MGTRGEDINLTHLRNILCSLSGISSGKNNWINRNQKMPAWQQSWVRLYPPALRVNCCTAVKDNKNIWEDCLFYSGSPEVCKWLPKKKKKKWPAKAEVPLPHPESIRLQRSWWSQLNNIRGKGFSTASSSEQRTETSAHPPESLPCPRHLPPKLPGMVSPLFACLPFSRRARWTWWKIPCQYFGAVSGMRRPWHLKVQIKAATNNVIRVLCSCISS